MEAETIAAFDSVRDLSSKPFRAICYAPFNSMYLDTLGLVRACCVNRRYVLGDINKDRLDDVWFGERFRKLREAMKRYDLRLGCEHCQWQIDDGNLARDPSRHSSLHAFKYERFDVRPDDALWPSNIEFNLSNTCNLECVMCGGEFSSSIRSRREKLPPLPRPYNDQFFEDLEKYIPHLKTAQFLGGEPFLIVEHFRVWDMMIASGTMREVDVTTNGTIYNHRVEKILDSLPVWICMSIDGYTKETFESIRVNAVYETFMENFRRFHAYSERHGRRINFNYTLSRLNYHEFADFLLFAEDYNAAVSVCTLVAPEEFSLYATQEAELVDILHKLEARDADATARLKVNLGAWTSALDSLRHRLKNLQTAVLPLAQKGKAVSVDADGLVIFSPPVSVESLAPPETNGARTELVDSLPKPDEARTSSLAEELLPTPPHRHWRQFQAAQPFSVEEQVAVRARAEANLGEGSSFGVARLESNSEDVVVDSCPGFLGEVGTDLVGMTLDDVFGVLMGCFGSDAKITDVHVAADRTERLVEFQNTDGVCVTVRAVSLPRFDEFGEILGITTLIGRETEVPAAS